MSIPNDLALTEEVAVFRLIRTGMLCATLCFMTTCVGCYVDDHNTRAQQTERIEILAGTGSSAAEIKCLISSHSSTTSTDMSRACAELITNE